jgi:hypothetical protein
MRVGLFLNTCATNGIEIMKRFAEGVIETGDQAIFLNTPTEEVDIAVIWSVLWNNKVRKDIWDFYQAKKIPVIVLEVGSLIRNKSWRIGLNGIVRDVNHNFFNLDQNRIKKFGIKNQPWRTEGTKILICGQNERSKNWPLGFSTHEWVEGLIKEITKYHDKEILFRPHPRFDIKIKGCETVKPKYIGGYDDYDLLEALSEICLVCNYNSNPGVESVLHGVSVYTDKSSLAYPVSIKELKNLNNLYPDRNEWLLKITHLEWFEDEIEEGIPYKRIKDIL